MGEDFAKVSVALELEADTPFPLRTALSCLLEAVADALPGSALGHAKALADYGSGRLYASCTVVPPEVNFTPEDLSPILTSGVTIFLTCIFHGVAGDGLSRAVDAGLTALEQAGFFVRKETDVH